MLDGPAWSSKLVTVLKANMNASLRSGVARALSIKRPAIVANMVDTPTRRPEVDFKLPALTPLEDRDVPGLARAVRHSKAGRPYRIDDEAYHCPARLISEIDPKKILAVSRSARIHVIALGADRQRSALHCA